MALTPSTMIPLGTIAPNFRLPNTVSGAKISLEDLDTSSGLLVMFICNHCPFVKHVQDELARLGNEYSERGISVVAISANDVANYPEDSPENMKALAEELGFKFPYLYDESQLVAKEYDAVCTPDFYVFDKELKCVYRGQLDGSRPGNDVPVTGKDIRAALDALLHGTPISDEQIPSVGCNIKWK